MLRWRLDGDAVLHNTIERDYPPSLLAERLDSARQPHREELPNMERNAQEELKAHLMMTNGEFQRLCQQHSEYAKQLEALEAQAHLTEEEQLEEVRLKKLKLRLKDQMEAIMSQYRSQQVA
jgi:uncharacterized protein YdcH (DUF465 family)